MKPRVAVHKFSSCDGCQLAFLNLGPALVELAQLVDLVHFVEAGPVDPDAKVDVAFIEGSVTTPEDFDRIKQIRENSTYLVALGSCATSGGVQALRNLANVREWIPGVYASPECIHTLDRSSPIAEHVRVDMELWGCPVNGRQVIAAVRALLFGVAPVDEKDKLCQECKRRQTVCVLVAKGIPCMGPVTRTGCGALCPSFGRDCYACYGPAENVNTASLTRCFEGLGLMPEAIARRFLSINNAAPVFRQAGEALQARSGGKTGG